MFADQGRILTGSDHKGNFRAEVADSSRRHPSSGDSNDDRPRCVVNGSSPSASHPYRSQHPPVPVPNTMVSGGDRKGVMVERYDFVSRRDTARRNLMGHLYTRQPVLKRSYSFVAGERPATETLLPQLNRREKHSAISFNSEKYAKPVRPVRNPKQGERNTVKRNGGVQSPSGKKTVTTSGTRPGSHQISLPELINDINRLHSPGDSDGEDSDGGHKIPLDLIRSMDRKPLSGPIKTKAVRYRPITPGVIEKLNKLRLSSKIRTEQWVKTLPLDYRATYSELADDNQTEPSEHSPKEKEWIYTTT